MWNMLVIQYDQTEYAIVDISLTGNCRAWNLNPMCDISKLLASSIDLVQALFWPQRCPLRQWNTLSMFNIDEVRDLAENISKKAKTAVNGLTVPHYQTVMKSYWKLWQVTVVSGTRHWTRLLWKRTWKMSSSADVWSEGIQHLKNYF